MSEITAQVLSLCERLAEENRRLMVLLRGGYALSEAEKMLCEVEAVACDDVDPTSYDPDLFYTTALYSACVGKGE